MKQLNFLKVISIKIYKATFSTYPMMHFFLYEVVFQNTPSTPALTQCVYS